MTIGVFWLNTSETLVDLQYGSSCQKVSYIIYLYPVVKGYFKPLGLTETTMDISSLNAYFNNWLSCDDIIIGTQKSKTQ